MVSSFGWLDFSETERQRMLDVIRLFKDRDTRDELGIGTVRDAYADLLFPGTSTIQTRARYMLFIPWIYLGHEKRRTPVREIAGKARRDEVSLIYALLGSDDTDGVIGKEAKEHLQRLPSTIYWSGLGVWGIRRFEGSQDQYHRSLTEYYQRKRSMRREEAESPDGILANNWDPALPPSPAGFPSSASFQLTRVEAEYLHDRVMNNCRGTLLAFLVDRTRPLNVAIDFVWEHPELATFPTDLREQVEHARNFSETMHGAALLYNLMLAETSGAADLEAEYRDNLSEWEQELAARPVLHTWNRARFWETALLKNPDIPYTTRQFVDTWLDLTLPGLGKGLADNPMARRLVRSREIALKRNRARLENRRALDLWNGAAGTGRLAFRWRVAGTVVNDILLGLEGDHA